MHLTLTLNQAPITITGDPGEMAQLIRRVGSAAVAALSAPPATPAKPPASAAKQPRPKCSICDRNHAKGNCKEMGMAAITKAVSS